MFPITMSFTVSTQAELARLLGAVHGNPTNPGVAEKPAEKLAEKLAAEKPATGEAKAAARNAKAAADTPPTAPAAVAQQPKGETSDAPLDYERDVRPRFLALASAPGKGREAQLKVLALAGCDKKLTEVAGTQEGLRKALAAVAQVEAE